MKINKIELTKTISDFLFLGSEKPEEKAKKIFQIKHFLTDYWFKKYLQYYFQKYKNYTVSINKETIAKENGIDLKWVKYRSFQNYFLIAQCKKYTIKSIGEESINAFYSKIIHKIKNKKKITELFFITTTNFTKKAKDFWKQQGIKLIDFHDIYKLQLVYPLEKFKQDLFYEEGKNELKKSFSNLNILREDFENSTESEIPSNTEVYDFLKKIRREISTRCQINWEEFIRDDTLKILATIRPHNREALKNIIEQNIKNSEEKQKLTQYGKIFTERLKYLSHKETKAEKQKNIFSFISRR
jgi:hypothetical protein